jgi:hypothetical protein
MTADISLSILACALGSPASLPLGWSNVTLYGATAQWQPSSRRNVGGVRGCYSDGGQVKLPSLPSAVITMATTANARRRTVCKRGIEFACQANASIVATLWAASAPPDSSDAAPRATGG